MITVADVMTMPIAANTVIVDGSATIWPIACSRCDRPKRVKSGMLSDSVDQNADRRGQRRDEHREELAGRVERAAAAR